MPDWSPIRRLGTGAFGEVWLMVDRALGAQRAVKFIRPNRIHDPSNFYAEPQALVELQHEYIVQVHDAGTLPDGRLYVAMEYLPDGSVEDSYQGSIVPVARALSIVSDACRGIEYAHSRGYVHRDVKPANLLLSHGRAKVSDFGLATRTTGTGAASPYGYVSHCAPEVIDPGETTVRTDVYALGITLYRLLNGDAVLPDPAQLGTTLPDAILAGTFPPRSVFADHVPEPIRRVVRKAIAMEPVVRTESAAALRHDIERVMPAVSFAEVATTDVAEWVGESGTHTWQVVITRIDGGYELSVRRGRIGGGQVRRVGAESGTFATVSAARRQARDFFTRISRR